MREGDERESEKERLKSENQRLNKDLEKAKKREEDLTEAKDLREQITTLRREIIDVCQVQKEEQDDTEKLTAEVDKFKKIEDEKQKKMDIRWVGMYSKEEEMVRLKTKIEELKIDKSLETKTDDAKQFQNGLDKLKNQLLSEQTEFEQERITWAQEKEKVLRYQRQLQLNYVQMFRRTRTLEAEIESLTMELELETKTKGFRTPKNISVPAQSSGTVVEL